MLVFISVTVNQENVILVTINVSLLLVCQSLDGQATHWHVGHSSVVSNMCSWLQLVQQHSVA